MAVAVGGDGSDGGDKGDGGIVCVVDERWLVLLVATKKMLMTAQEGA